MDLVKMKQTFNELFNKPAEQAFFAPGRINLIGEHIDYNGGLVFPCPITYGTYALTHKREDSVFNLYSMNFEDLGVLTFSLDDLTFKEEHSWANYVKGMLKVLLEKGYTAPFGLDIVVFGNLPNGAGLSSSASLEMLMAYLFKTYYCLDFSQKEAALMGKEVENGYIGVQSGIMDQFAIALGKKDHAMLLDCNTQQYSYYPFPLEEKRIIIMNSNKRRELASSKYNERRGECESALSKLVTYFKLDTLCDLKCEDLDRIPENLLTPLEFQRVRHVVSENERVKAATTALTDNDLVKFGQLLTSSHVSLQKDYEVTGIELDTLVEAALSQKGVLGARMTGAGFGGCAISLVEKEDCDAFIEEVGRLYKEKIGYDASFYMATIGDGPTSLSLE
jgi:galactokinase